MLYNFLTGNTQSNTATGVGRIYSTNPSHWSLGDILQFKPSGQTDYAHSTIITVKVYSSDRSRAYATVTGRASDTSYNNNTPAANIYPGSTKRIIFVYNR